MGAAPYKYAKEEGGWFKYFHIWPWKSTPVSVQQLYVLKSITLLDWTAELLDEQ